jgi:hypothetical protein
MNSKKTQLSFDLDFDNYQRGVSRRISQRQVEEPENLVKTEMIYISKILKALS